MTGDDKNCSIKINFYKTGSVVIQGAKCVQFSDLYFLPLKDKSDLNNSVQGDTNDSDLNLDKTKVELKLEENNLLDNSVTFAKTLIHDNNTSTPIRNNTTEQANEHVESPKERITKHSQTLSTKIDRINVTLSTMDNSFKQFINKLTDLKNVTNNLVPNIKNAVPEIIASNQKL